MSFPPAMALHVSPVEKVAGQASGWLCPRKPALSPALFLPLSILEVPWAKVRIQMWILLRALGSSGRAGAASSAPEACSGETTRVWGSTFKYVPFLSTVLPLPHASLAFCFTNTTSREVELFGGVAASPGSQLPLYGLSRHSSGPSSSPGDDLLIRKTSFPAAPAWQGSLPAVTVQSVPRGRAGATGAVLRPGSASPAGAAGTGNSPFQLTWEQGFWQRRAARVPGATNRARGLALLRGESVRASIAVLIHPLVRLSPLRKAAGRRL